MPLILMNGSLLSTWSREFCVQGGQIPNPIREMELNLFCNPNALGRLRTLGLSRMNGRYEPRRGELPMV